MQQKVIHVGILRYPGAMLSAVHGLEEMFLLSNKIRQTTDTPLPFQTRVFDATDIDTASRVGTYQDAPTLLQILILPPSITGEYALQPSDAILDWVRWHHQQGTTVCTVCAGVFILAATGLLKNRKVTTHWEFVADFSKRYPDIALNENKIIINDGDIITSGGLMSWVDLGLELIAQFVNSHHMRLLGKILIVDTGSREQRYYKSFSPTFDHGDKKILQAQHYIQMHYGKTLSVTTLSTLVHLSERTFFRRFVEATQRKPIQYIQQVRVQKACELMETTRETVEEIAYQVGYQDTSAFRKVFIKIVGLSPRAFRRRFGCAPTEHV